MRAEVSARMVSALRMCLVAVVLAGLLASAAQAGNAITGLNVMNKADRVIINIQSSTALRLTLIVSARGAYLGFQIPCLSGGKGPRGGRAQRQNMQCALFQLPGPSAEHACSCELNREPGLFHPFSDDKKQVEITVWKHGRKPAGKQASAPPSFNRRSNRQLPPPSFVRRSTRQLSPPLFGRRSNRQLPPPSFNRRLPGNCPRHRSSGGHAGSCTPARYDRQSLRSRSPLPASRTRHSRLA